MIPTTIPIMPTIVLSRVVLSDEIIMRFDTLVLVKKQLGIFIYHYINPFLYTIAFRYCLAFYLSIK
jgi:hypothetical protein